MTVGRLLLLATTFKAMAVRSGQALLQILHIGDIKKVFWSNAFCTEQLKRYLHTVTKPRFKAAFFNLVGLTGVK